MQKFTEYLETIAQINNLGNGTDSNSNQCVANRQGNISANALTVEQKTCSEIQWLFHSGMLFQSKNIWWDGFQKRRSSTHEGIDISYHRHSEKSETHCFDDSIIVPALDDGIVLNICNDFLGKSIIIKQHDFVMNSRYKRQVLYVYAHILPLTDLKPGLQIKKGSVIAKICNTDKNPLLTPHLHFSCFEIPSDIMPEKLNWDLFTTSLNIDMINPVFL